MSDSSSQATELTLSQSEVKALSLSHIKGVDKWNRMLQGLASDLERYENGILYLKIDNTETKLSSSQKTAVEIAHTWVRFNDKLKGAKGFVAMFYTSGSTGFMVNADAVGKKDVIGKLVQDFVSSGQQKKELVNIFSGLLVKQLPAEERKI